MGVGLRMFNGNGGGRWDIDGEGRQNNELKLSDDKIVGVGGRSQFSNSQLDLGGPGKI